MPAAVETLVDFSGQTPLRRLHGDEDENCPVDNEIEEDDPVVDALQLADLVHPFLCQHEANTILAKLLCAPVRT